MGLDVIGRIYIAPRTRLLTARPTCDNALQTWHTYQPEDITSGLDDQGLRTNAFQAALRASPKFIDVPQTLTNQRRWRCPVSVSSPWWNPANRDDVPRIQDDA
jgi:hypothetical protein